MIDSYSFGQRIETTKEAVTSAMVCRLGLQLAVEAEIHNANEGLNQCSMLCFISTFTEPPLKNAFLTSVFNFCPSNQVFYGTLIMRFTFDRMRTLTPSKNLL